MMFTRTLCLCGLLLWSCAPTPAKVAPRALARVAAADGGSAQCAGGLLCEDPQLLLSWRVPVGCERRKATSTMQTCWLPATEWARVLEFFRSRYDSVTLDAKGAKIYGKLPPLLAQRRADAPLTAEAPARVAPLLLLQQKAQGAELVAIAGDDLPAPSR